MADFLELAGLSAAALNADLLPSTDVSSYKVVSLQVVTIGTGVTLAFQCSNDNVNFRNTVGVASTIITGGPQQNTAAIGLFYIPVRFRYLRVRQTAFTSGTSTGVAEFYVSDASELSIAGQFQLVAGSQNVGTFQQSTNNAPIAVGAANTVVKATAGYLATIVVTTAGTTGFTVFDNASTNAGTQLYNSKTAPALGDIYTINGVALLGIVVQNTATGPALTVFFN